VWPLTLSVKAAIFPVHSDHSVHSERYALCGRDISHLLGHAYWKIFLAKWLQSDSTWNLRWWWQYTHYKSRVRIQTTLVDTVSEAVPHPTHSTPLSMSIKNHVAFLCSYVFLFYPISTGARSRRQSLNSPNYILALLGPTGSCPLFFCLRLPIPVLRKYTLPLSTDTLTCSLK